MRLDWYVTRPYGIADEVDEEQVFRIGGRPQVLVLVENREEQELVLALQYMYGSEISPTVWDRTCLTELRTQFAIIYTTWDPFDPNRI